MYHEPKYFYLAGFINSDNKYISKVGITANPKRRISSLSSVNKTKFHHIYSREFYSIDKARELETYIYQRFPAYKGREYLNTHPDEVIEVINGYWGEI